MARFAVSLSLVDRWERELALPYPPSPDSGRRQHQSRTSGHRRKRASRRISAIVQMRRTGVATAVVSTLGIAMINTTGIAHSDASRGAELRGTPNIAGAAGFPADGGTDMLSDPH